MVAFQVFSAISKTMDGTPLLQENNRRCRFKISEDSELFSLDGLAFVSTFVEVGR